MAMLQTYIAFIRGINVGGIILKMDTLKTILTGLDLKNVKTYIQSGNAIFESEVKNNMELEKIIRDEIGCAANINVEVIIKTKEELKNIVSLQPFDKCDKEKIYYTLLNCNPSQDKIKAFMEINTTLDKLIVLNDVVYSYYENGYGKSKYSNNFIEKKLGVTGTTRNQNTMNKILEMII